MSIGAILGIIMFLILPSGWKLLGFVSPALSLSIVFSHNNRINLSVLLLLSLIYIIFPSSLLSLDSSASIPVNKLVNFIDTSISWVGHIVAVGIPLLLLGTAIASYAKLSFTEGNKIVLKLFIIVVFLFIFVYLSGLFGWNFGIGSIDGLRNVINRIIKWFSNIGLSPDSTDYNSFSLDATNSAGETGIMLMTGFPVALSLVELIFAFIFFIKREKNSNKKSNSDKIIENFFKKEQVKTTKPMRFNVNMVYTLVIMLVIGFALFLSYDVETMLTYQSIGYFTIYLEISIVSLLLLSFGVGCYTKTSKNWFYGIVFGVVGLYIYFNLFSQTSVLEMLSIEFSEVSVSKIISQFLFVAPTESLLFHILIPGLYMFSIMYYNERNSNEKIKQKIDEYNAENVVLETFSNTEFNLNQISIEKNTSAYKNMAREILKNKRNIQRLKKKLTEDVVSDTEIDMSNNQFYIYIVIVILSNVLFSTFHFFKSGLSLIDFWNIGLGLLYMGAGCWISLMGYRYGWLSAILVHALNNAITLLMMFGVI